MNIVITGCFNSQVIGHHGRDELRRRIRLAGHNVRTEVNSKTDYLVAGDSPGQSKMATAQELGIPIINTARLSELLAA